MWVHSGIFIWFHWSVFWRICCFVVCLVLLVLGHWTQGFVHARQTLPLKHIPRVFYCCYFSVPCCLLTFNLTYYYYKWFPPSAFPSHLLWELSWASLHSLFSPSDFTWVLRILLTLSGWHSQVASSFALWAISLSLEFFHCSLFNA